jgi:hypothetical protein
MAKVSSGKEYFGVKRFIEASHGRDGCLKITTMIDGVFKKFEACTVGGSRQPSLHISRTGRRGGIRGEGKKSGGLTVCDNKGQASKCIRASSVSVFPGGAGKLKKKGVQVLNGLRRKRKKGGR